MADNGDAIAALYAPIVFLHRDERHFPVHPDEFRETCRFRRSVPGKDLGWNKTSDKWEPGNEASADFLNAPWVRIILESNSLLGQDQEPAARDYCRNVRPRDGQNVADGSQQGLFLELEDKRGHHRATGRRDPKSWAMFYDRYDVDGQHLLAFWVFYAFNYGWADHEGDWEHIRLQFGTQAPDGKGRPENIWYAQHNGGTCVSGLAPRQYDKEEGLHPRVYVSTWGHASEPWVADRTAYERDGTTWRSWEQGTLAPLDRQPWMNYAGAWGEVGQFGFSTGPLGPRFKRRRCA